MMDLIVSFFDYKGILLTAAVFIPLEHLWPRRRKKKILRPAWKTDLVYLLVNGTAIKCGLLLLLLAMTAAFDWPVIDALRQRVALQPDWLQAIELIVLADLGFYWSHRAFHKFPFLWKFHSIHHSIEEMDWLAGHRVHFIDQTLVKAASMLPFILLDFSGWALAAYVLTYKWQSVLLHSNVSVDFGPMKRLIASPTFHHWHHSKQVEAHDKNFSGQLAFWDYIFGTAHLPSGRSPTHYGIVDPVPSGFVDQLFHPFRRGVVVTPLVTASHIDASSQGIEAQSS